MNKKIFTALWTFPPNTSGASIAGERTLANSELLYDVVCGVFDDGHIRTLSNKSNVTVYPLAGEKYILWPFKVKKLFRQLNKTVDYDIVYSRVHPTNGHFAAWLVKHAHPQIKWVVCFTDPVWNNPFYTRLSYYRGIRNILLWILAQIMGIFAKVALHEGDLLVFDSQRMARHVLGKYYEDYKHKLVIAPFGHEGVRQTAGGRQDKKIVLAHVGQIYWARSLENIIAALEMFASADAQLLRRLTIRLVGNVEPAELKRIAKSTCHFVFECTGNVSYRLSIEEMERADCLLLLDPQFKRKKQNVFTPSKVFDYMSAGKPVLAIADPDSATADIVEKAHILRAGHEPKEIFLMLRNVLEYGPPEADIEAYRTFHVKKGCGMLDKAIRALRSGNNV